MNLSPYYFSFGAIELIAMALVIIPAVILYLRGSSGARYFIGASVAVFAAAAFTPADLISTLLLALPLFAMFLLGGRMNRAGRPTAS